MKKNFGETVKECRYKMQLSAVRFADYLEIPVVTLRKYEESKMIPNLSRAQFMAGKLSFSLDALSPEIPPEKNKAPDLTRLELIEKRKKKWENEKRARAEIIKHFEDAKKCQQIE